MRSGEGQSMRMRRARPGIAGAAGVSVVAALLAVLLQPAPAAARQGLYAGLGLSSQTFSDDIQGTEIILNAAGTQAVRVGKPDAGTGLAFNGGFGFNDYVGLDLLLTLSKHDTVFGPAAPVPQSFSASLRTVLFGLRFGAPLGDVAEVFGRAGIGGYELIYDGSNFTVPGGVPTDNARLSGSGFGYGVGGELFFGALGLQLAYTFHDAEFSSVDSLGFSGAVNPTLETTIQSVSLTLNYYLQ